MSYDFRLLQPCPHRIVADSVDLALDAQTMRLDRFVANKTTVELLMNGSVKVPQIGLQSSARVVGGAIGPYNIQTGVNDLLSLRSNGGDRQTLVLLQGDQVPIADLVPFLNSQVSGVRFSQSRGHLVVRSVSTGPDATIWLEPELDDTTGEDIGTGHATLGLPNRFEARGQELVPPWVVEAQPRTIPPLQPMQIRFVRPLRTFKNFFEVTYHTVLDVCPRCHGIGLEYDYVPAADGDPDIVENEDLLVQMVEKIILTILGSDPYALWYGTDLTRLVGTKAVPFLRREITRQITTALAVLQNIQSQQQRVQLVTDAEFLARIERVDVEQAPNISPTLFLVNVSFSTRAGTQSEVAQAINFGGAADLLGSTPPDRRIEAYTAQQSGLVRRA